MTYFLLAAAVVSGVAAWTDWRTGRIPNWLTVGALGAAILGHLARGWDYAGPQEGLKQVVFALAGAALCSLIPGMMYWKKAIGGGDLKLLAAIGALLHPLAGLEAQTYAFFAAALIAPARLAYKGVLFKTLGTSLAIVANPLRRKEKRKEIPQEMLTWFRLGPCIFLGTCATVVAHLDLWRPS